MKKSDGIISFISILLPTIVSLPLMGSTNKSINYLGFELFLLPIGLIIIFMCNNKKIKVPINLKKLKLVPYIFFISLSCFTSVICIICITEFLKIGDSSLVDSTPELNIISVISITIIGPICEEILFRAGILGALLKKFSKHIAILIQGIIFAFIHCFSLTSVTFYIVIVGGISLGYVYYYTHNILSSILYHAIYNFLTISPLDLTLKTISTSIFIGSIFLEVISLILIVYLIKKIKTRTLKE